jgi:hypothetical protein
LIVQVAGDLLGHANLDTTDRYYKQSRTVDASRHHLVAGTRNLTQKRIRIGVLKIGFLIERTGCIEDQYGELKRQRL